jgi:hypothetical protein
MVEFPTWSKSVSGITKESTLDQIYTDNPTGIKNIYSGEPILETICYEYVALIAFNQKQPVDLKRSGMKFF